MFKHTYIGSNRKDLCRTYVYIEMRLHGNIRRDTDIELNIFALLSGDMLDRGHLENEKLIGCFCFVEI